MKLRHCEIKIDLKDPFQNCKLNRKSYALILTDLVKNYKDGFVLTIDSEWGSGKTTFVKMWRQHLKNEGFKTLYFNAWENDYDDNILVSLISELNDLKNLENENAFKLVVRNALPLVKSLTLGVLSTQVEKITGEKFIKDFIKYSSINSEETLVEQIKAHVEKKEIIDKFKTSLQEYLSQTSEKKPVIFFIDEMDRCRPSFAVELLEKIKHLFYVHGIIFVLSIDKVQLCNAIKGFYGSDLIDSTEYLRRFIDIEYILPEPTSSTFTKYLYEYFGFDDFFLNETRMKYSIFHYDKSEFNGFASSFFAFKKLSLRVQEKLFAHLRLALTQFNHNSYVVPSLLVLLTYLNLFHRPFYNNLRNNKLTIQKIVTEIEKIIPQDVTKNELSIYMYTISMFIITYNNSKEYGEREELIIQAENGSEKKLAFKSNFDKPTNNKKLINLLDTSGGIYSEIKNLSINHLITKIDITETLNFI